MLVTGPDHSETKWQNRDKKSGNTFPESMLFTYILLPKTDPMSSVGPLMTLGCLKDRERGYLTCFSGAAPVFMALHDIAAIFNLDLLTPFPTTTVNMTKELRLKS